MPHFRYRALTRAGEVVVGEVEAPSREEVLRRIEYLGHLPIETETASKGILGSSGWNVKKANARDITIFLRQLALLVGSGLTLEAALQTLSDDNGNKAVAKFSGALRSSIAAGDGFAEALERHTTIIEPIYIAMVRAGEASGKLDAVLQAIVQDRTRKELLGDRINSAIRYPLFLVGSAVLILFFFLLYVVPQFEPVFRDLGGKLNAGAAFVLTASTWLTANLNFFLGSIVVVVLVVWLVFSRRENRGRLTAM